MRHERDTTPLSDAALCSANTGAVRALRCTSQVPDLHALLHGVHDETVQAAAQVHCRTCIAMKGCPGSTGSCTSPCTTSHAITQRAITTSRSTIKHETLKKGGQRRTPGCCSHSAQVCTCEATSLIRQYRSRHVQKAFCSSVEGVTGGSHICPAATTAHVRSRSVTPTSHAWALQHK